MKKFTSLFALLSCLCVVSAQANVTVHVYGSDPSNQKMYWWGYADAPTWNTNEPSFTQLNGQSVTKDGDLFYTKVLTPVESNNGHGIILKYNGNQTSDIVLDDGSEIYIYYFGHNKHDESGFKGYYTDVPVYFELVGSFNNWGEHKAFDRNCMTNWTCEWDLSTATDNIEFKFKTPGMNNDQGWFGVGQIPFTYPAGLVSTDKGNGNNFELKLSDTKYKKFKLTATWVPNTDFTANWSVEIEPIDTYTVGNNTYDITDNNVLTLTDGSAFSATNSFTAASATYSRNFVNNWGTLCLPFAISTVPEGVTFYELSRVNTSENTLTFSPTSTPISAGQPIVFKVGDGVILSISESQVTVKPNITPVDGPNGWTLNGTYTEQEVTGSNLYYIAQNKFWHASEITALAYRAWFSGSMAAPAPFRIETSDTEDIQYVEQEDGTVKAYFDIQGRKLDSARKGLVIENGKIIMVK